MKNSKLKFILGLVPVLLLVPAGFYSSAIAQTQKMQPAAIKQNVNQQPLYSEYRGVRLGMMAKEVRAKLGASEAEASDFDYYVFSENERAQLVYDATGKVAIISVDYLRGVGAPDHKSVVGGELEETPSGGLYRVARYESEGFWVSYNRTGGADFIVTITIQVMR